MQKGDINVSIKSGTLIAMVLVVAGAWVAWILRDLLLLVLTSIILASAIEPQVAFFVRYRIPRFLAVTLVYFFVFGLIFWLLYFFLPPIISDAADFLSSAPKYLETFNAADSFSSIKSVASIISSGSHDVSSFVQTLFSLKDLFVAGTGGAVQVFVSFFGGIFSLILVVVLSFYFALQDTGVDDFLHLVMPVRYENYAVDLWRRAQRKIGLWMQGQILLSFLVAILIYLGLLILEVPYALLLAVFAGLAEIIPIFGSWLAGIIAVLIAFSSGGIALATIVAGLYIVVNQFEANLIYPLIVKKVIGVPPLLVIVALIAGGTLAGFLGILLSVPIAAVLLELITDFDRHKRSMQSA